MISDEQIQSYIDDGNLWRAREVLQGRISNAGYDVELYEKLGSVLLRMHDPLTAGKYLFLSGVRKPEYEEAIHLFLGRFAKAGAGQIIAALPKSFRKISFDALPDIVREDLIQRGFQEEDFDVLERHLSTKEEGGGIGGMVGGAIVFLLLLGLLVSALRGLYWLVNMAFG